MKHPDAARLFGLGALALASGACRGPHADAVNKGPHDPELAASAAVVATAGDRATCRLPGYVLDDSYDRRCGFCVPASSEALPPPIAWRPCRSGALSPAVSCEEMVEGWDPGSFAPERISQVAPGWVHDGVVTFALSRLEESTVLRVVADADGPVRQSILETSPQTCTLGAYDLRDGRVVYRVYDSETGRLSSRGGGSLAADVGALRPRVMTHTSDPSDDDRSYFVSALGVFELRTRGSSLERYDWVSGEPLERLDSASEDDGKAIAHVWPRGGAVYWDSYSGSTRKLRVWAPREGTRDLFAPGNREDTDFADLGVDDAWMAWSERDARRSTGDAATPAVRLMAREISASGRAAELARVSEVGFSSSPFIVGCGYAARLVTTAAGSAGAPTLTLFRLRDGARWSLPNTPPMRWSAPIAISCTELFARAVVSDGGGEAHSTIARVALASLSGAEEL